MVSLYRAVKQIWWHMIQDNDGHRTYFITWFVTADGDWDRPESDATLTNATGLPRMGDVLPEDPYAVLRQPPEEWEITPSHTGDWLVRQKYTTREQ